MLKLAVNGLRPYVSRTPSALVSVPQRGHLKTLHPFFTWFTRYNPNESSLPSFSKISDSEIGRESGINPNLTYQNNLFWTPRFYQAPHLSTEFEQEILKFRNLHVWEDKHVLALTQLILIEATRDTTFDVSFNFRAKHSSLCQYHGEIDCLLYQRYGGDIDHGVADLADELDDKGDEKGIGFPLIPIFFPLQRKGLHTSFTQEFYPNSQAVSCGMWCLEHMQEIDPDIQYARVIQTDGHRWKLFEIHRTHVKKTKFFRPRAAMRQHSRQNVPFTDTPRFFDDYEHMLSVIGMLRFAMGIPENIIQASELYQLEELPPEKDPKRSIKQSLLLKTTTSEEDAKLGLKQLISSKSSSTVRPATPKLEGRNTKLLEEQEQAQKQLEQKSDLK